MKLDALQGTWVGTCELWLDPLGDTGQTSPCRLEVEATGVNYTWHHDGAEQKGSLVPTSDGANFTDTFHSASTMHCCSIPGSRGVVAVEGSYQETWGWRIGIAHRTPTDELVLQMTNIAPWGEEARAVRMVAKREGTAKTEAS
ncbi:MAG: hypothetical protein AAF928_19995 [Myxococcota bacterium]